MKSSSTTPRSRVAGIDASSSSSLASRDDPSKSSTSKSKPSKSSSSFNRRPVFVFVFVPRVALCRRRRPRRRRPSHQKRFSTNSLEPTHTEPNRPIDPNRTAPSVDATGTPNSLSARAFLSPRTPDDAYDAYDPTTSTRPVIEIVVLGVPSGSSVVVVRASLRVPPSSMMMCVTFYIISLFYTTDPSVCTSIRMGDVCYFLHTHSLFYTTDPSVHVDDDDDVCYFLHTHSLFYTTDHQYVCVCII